MPIRSETVGAACLITLDQPEKRNAQNLDDITELTSVVAAAGARSDINGVVITGNGAFCAGADVRRLDTVGTTEPERRGSIEGPVQGLIWALLDVAVPTIAAVDGPAIGVGFDLALTCDSLLVGADGWCMQGWGRIGLIPGTGGDLLLRARAAPHVLWRLLEHQPKIDGPMAEHWHLGEAVAAGTAREAALQRIERLGERLSREALAGYVTLSRSEIKTRLAEHLPTCAVVQARLLGREELADRVQSVLPAQD